MFSVCSDSSVSGYDAEGVFTSQDTQIGLLDTPKVITYGAGGNSANGHITMSAGGVVTINTSGYYAFKLRSRITRTGPAGFSSTFFWAEISIDGGTTWNITGNSVDIKLDSGNEVDIFFDFSPLYFPSGVMLRNSFARNGDNVNDGNLVASAPSAALSGLGVPDSPSAQLTVYRV